jgi:LEA14-like dessication related protein
MRTDPEQHKDNPKTDPLALDLKRRVVRLVVIAAAVLGLVALAGLVSGCSGAIKPPTLQVADVRVASLDRDSLVLTVTLSANNSNSIDLNLSDIQAKISLAGEEIATANSVQPSVRLPASGSVAVPIRLQIGLQGAPAVLKKSAVALLTGGLPYQVKGSVTTLNGLITVPFEKSGMVSPKAR